MKKIIFIILGALILVIGIVVLINYITQRPVSVTLKGSGYSVDILNSDRKVTTLTGSGEVRLHDGNYIYKVVGDGYSNESVAFTVTKDADPITVDPPYSTEKLASLLDTQRQAITDTLSLTYAGIFDSFEYYQLDLHDKGEWAAGILRQIVDRRDSPDYYRFVAKKDGTSWKVVVPPQIAIQKSGYPDVPEEILYSLYSESTLYSN